MTARDKLEAYLITVRPRTPGPMAEQPSCPPPRRPCPVTSLALSVCVSPWTIHFLVLDKNPLLGPGRGPPSCNSFSDCFWNTYESTGRVISPISSSQDWYLPHKNPACCPSLGKVTFNNGVLQHFKLSMAMKTAQFWFSPAEFQVNVLHVHHYYQFTDLKQKQPLLVAVLTYSLNPDHIT